mmetsp:Transcript_42854/g.126967  ORF Transcript_42854/g.126967 Transcript_42854/m.126967 type:complete len:782 (+) Transcript_42854:170-2515(+)
MFAAPPTCHGCAARDARPGARQRPIRAPAGQRGRAWERCPTEFVEQHSGGGSRRAAPLRAGAALLGDGLPDNVEVAERPLLVDLELQALLVAEVEGADEADRDAEVLGLALRQPADRAAHEVLEAGVHELLAVGLARHLGVLDVVAHAVPEVLLHQLHIHELGVPAVADLGGAHHVRLLGELEVEAAGHLVALVDGDLANVAARRVAAREHPVVRAEEEVLRVHVHVRRQAVGVELFVAILAEAGVEVHADVVVIVASPAGQARGEPGVRLRVLDDHGREEVAEAVRPVAGRLGLLHELQHEVGAEAEAREVALGPRRPAGHRDAVDHVGRHVLVQLPLRGALAELMLVHRLRLDGPGRLVERRQVEERPLLGLLLRKPLLRGDEGAARIVGVRQRVAQLAVLVPRKLLGPAGVEVGELVPAAPAAELLEEVVEGDDVLVAAEAHVAAGVRQWQGRVRRARRREGVGHAAGRGEVAMVREAVVAARSEGVVRRVHDGHRPVQRRRARVGLSDDAEQGVQAVGQGHVGVGVAVEAPPEIVDLRAQPRVRDLLARRDGLAEAKGLGVQLLGLLEALGDAGSARQGHVAVEDQREVLRDGQVAEQQALRAAGVELRGHPAEGGVALLVGLYAQLQDVRLVPLQGVHAADASLLGSLLAALAGGAVVLGDVGGAQASQHLVRVCVDGVHAAGVDPGGGLDGAARLVEAVLLLLVGAVRCEGLPPGGGGSLAALDPLRAPFLLGLLPAHEGVDDVLHVLDEGQVEGILHRDLVLVDELDALGVEVP